MSACAKLWKSDWDMQWHLCLFELNHPESYHQCRCGSQSDESCNVNGHLTMQHPKTREWMAGQVTTRSRDAGG